jgi:predicted permease
MQNLALLIFCFAIGVLLRCSGRIADGGHAPLNVFIIHVALPALILLHLHAARMAPEFFGAAAIAWAMFVLAVIFFVVIGRIMRIAPQTVGPLALTGGLANTSFIRGVGGIGPATVRLSRLAH